MQGSLAGIGIAIIEDDPLLRESLSLFLRVKGCRVETFGSAEEAVDAAKPGRFDIVVSDYLLPGENGLSFLRRVREDSGGAGTMLITAHAREDVRGGARAAGIDSLLPKPFSTDELEAVLRRIVEVGGTGRKGVVEAGS
jgi:DNA-binding response OmpR family regulator